MHASSRLQVLSFSTRQLIQLLLESPVTLTSEMVAVYSGASPPLEDVYCQLLNFIEVYEHNGSGWVFSNFASLQLTLWHLDPLHASALKVVPTTNNLSVNACGVENDEKMIYPLADRHADLPLYECNGIHHTTIKNFSLWC